MYTLGHNGRDFNEFIELLRRFSIEILVDIRRFPKSRFEWFNKEFLEISLPRYGVEYIALKELGALGISREIEPLPILSECTPSKTYRAYITYLLTNPKAKEALNKLMDLIKKNRVVCIMCRERIPWRCHRKYVSDILMAKGFKVIHILDISSVQEHRKTRCYEIIEKLIDRYSI